jgi:hypothetical protein
MDLPRLGTAPIGAEFEEGFLGVILISPVH